VSLYRTSTAKRESILDLYKEALQSFHDSLPKQHPDLIIIQLVIGDFYQSNGQRDSVLKH
jgi:hypothetical protein